MNSDYIASTSPLKLAGVLKKKKKEITGWTLKQYCNTEYLSLEPPQLTHDVSVNSTKLTCSGKTSFGAVSLRSERHQHQAGKRGAKRVRSSAVAPLSTPSKGIKFGQACRSLEQTSTQITRQTRCKQIGGKDESESRASQHAHEASAIAPQINSPRQLQNGRGGVNIK
jgi:hypothetical protein